VTGVKALIVDDHPLIQQAVSNVLRGLDPAAEIAVAGDCNSALDIAAAGVPEPDIVLLDLNLPGLSGIPALKRWRSRFPAMPVVVLSALDDRQTVRAAIIAGAAGYIPKSSSNEIMRQALSLILAGGKYLPPEIVAPAEDPRPSGVQRRNLQAATLPALTERQRDVLRLVAKGASNKRICRELGLAERTVKAHVSAVLRLLNVSSRTQAAVEAMKLGLADTD
jgi:DNA-binding NarL/FixJ family response regulator